VPSWLVELQEVWKYAAAIATGISAVAAVLLTFDALGGSRAVWALAGTAAVAGLSSVLALWLSGRKIIAAYSERATAARSADQWSRSPRVEASARYEDYLNTQVVPAFLDAGLDRTRDVFAEFIGRLDLSEDEREKEFAFLEATYADPQLTRREKIHRLVQHFAPEAELYGFEDDKPPSDA
jgi:hypothetical protein